MTQGTCQLSFHAPPGFTESDGDRVKARWENHGDPMKLTALRILINPASEAGHVVLSSIGRPARRTPGQHAQQAHLISPLIRHASETAVAQRQLVRPRMGPTTRGQTASVIRFRLCSPPGQAGQGRSSGRVAKAMALDGSPGLR